MLFDYLNDSVQNIWYFAKVKIHMNLLKLNQYFSALYICLILVKMVYNL